MSERESRGRDLRDFLEIGRRRKWLALGAFAAPFTAALGLALFLPDIYRSTATVLVERQEVPDAFAQPVAAAELDTRLQSIGQRILSRARLEDLVDRFSLYADLKGRETREATLERMRKDIQIELKGVDRASGRGETIAFTLGYRGRDPQTVARVTNTLASFYMEEDQQARERQTVGAAESLKLQLEQMKQRLDDQERRVGAFKTLHSGELPQQIEANLAALERLNTQLRINADAQARATERRDDLARQLSDAGVTGPAGETDVAPARLARLKSELADLRTRFSDKYPDVVRLQAEIDTLQQRIAAGEAAPGNVEPARPGAGDPAAARLRQRYATAQADVRVLRQEEERLKRSIDVYQGKVESAPKRDQELQELSRDYLATKDLYQTVLKRYQEAQIAESLEKDRKGEQFRILDEAIVPEEPAAPNRVRLAFMGLVLSIVLAVGAVALAEQIDTSFHSIEDLRGFSSIPVLISIPPILTNADIRRARRRVWIGVVPAALALAAIVAVAYLVARSNNPIVWMVAMR
ncbi:MAG: hypothetical protein DMF50_01150 [Acidobacteria bacterium]|nr:MAG: hypothetical protein DMF50_01150 [Acidobacteriota bacterium]